MSGFQKTDAFKTQLNKIAEKVISFISLFISFIL